MATYDDVMLIEDGDGDEAEVYAALQRQINTGLVWQLQGSMGRTAMQAIEAGYCLVGKVKRSDYWGGVVPSRDVVKAGTKGSRDYVAEAMGADWADMMAAVE